MINEEIELKKERYIFIIDLDNRGNKSSFWGLKKCYYIDHSIDLKNKFLMLLNNPNNFFLKNKFPNARKTLVFVKCIHGTGYDAMIEENKIRGLSRKKKEELINSEKNFLVCYNPISSIILRNITGIGEVVFKIG